MAVVLVIPATGGGRNKWTATFFAFLALLSASVATWVPAIVWNPCWWKMPNDFLGWIIAFFIPLGLFVTLLLWAIYGGLTRVGSGVEQLKQVGRMGRVNPLSGE